MIETFDSLNYIRVPVDSDWDVLWSHDYPFRTLKGRLSTLSSSHKVNHFPGSGFITNKMSLATSGLPYVPKAFQLPSQKEELISYSKNNPHKRFVQKSNNHRGIKIEKLELLDLSSNNSFVQEFISNPLLIDGHKFDVGTYVTLKSLKPLRIHIYNEILFRFCPEQYHPFDPEVLDKYVVGDDYLPIWKVPSLSKVYNDLGFGMKDTFDYWYKKNKGRSPDTIWAKVEDAIRSIYIAKEEVIIESTKAFTGGSLGRNFFEMVRFDFVIDDEGNVFIMEANMSPNLSSAHFPPNQLLYRQVLYNLFKLVGLAERKDSGNNAQVSFKQIAVWPDECLSNECLYKCDEDPKCASCQHCLSQEGIEIRMSAYLDELNKGGMLRIFPPSERYNESGTSLWTFDTGNLSKENKELVEWYRGKCLKDKLFC